MYRLLQCWWCSLFQTQFWARISLVCVVKMYHIVGLVEVLRLFVRKISYGFALYCSVSWGSLIALLSVEPSALRPPRPQKSNNSDFDREDRAMTKRAVTKMNVMMILIKDISWEMVLKTSSILDINLKWFDILCQLGTVRFNELISWMLGQN